MTPMMLDTTTVCHLMRGNPATAQRIQAVPTSALCISVISEAELRFGLARRPGAKRIKNAVTEFLKRIDVLPWDSAVAANYGPLRVGKEQQGRVLAPLDLLIAAHALCMGAVLVTNDKAFGEVPGLIVDDWT
jgi:tRNA(fMet)-specific endonuclease VapC